MAHQGFQVSVGEHGTGQWIAVFYSVRGGYEPVTAARTAQAVTERCSGRRGEAVDKSAVN
jgi:hypothetical protein